MKMKKILSMLTLATVLSSGVVAHAAGFTQDSNGNQSGWEYKEATATDMPKALEGEIEINGKFEKTINNLPTPDKDGRYLRVTMPIKMDYTYNVDSDQMVSAESSIINESLYATNVTTNGGANATLEPQAIKMQIVSLEDGTNGTMTPDVKFVSVVDSNVTDKVQLPFKLSITKSGSHVAEYNLSDLYQNSQVTRVIDVGASEKLQLQFKLIDGQKLGNGNLIDQPTSLTNHKLKMKFEYAGK